VRLIHEAFGLGVNFIDTAPSYGTEGVIGKALKSIPRSIMQKTDDGNRLSVDAIRADVGCARLRIKRGAEVKRRNGRPETSRRLIVTMRS
jgi:hypothetical protein